MPLGQYEDFGQCVQAQKMKGHDDESARKICGEMQARLEGSSSERKEGIFANNKMSEQQPPMNKPDNGNGGDKVELNTEDAGIIAQALLDANSVVNQYPDVPEEVKKELAAALSVVEKSFKIEEEGPAVPA